MLFEADASFSLVTQTLSTFGIGSKKQLDSYIHSILQGPHALKKNLRKLVLKNTCVFQRTTGMYDFMQDHGGISAVFKVPLEVRQKLYEGVAPPRKKMDVQPGF